MTSECRYRNWKLKLTGFLAVNAVLGELVGVNFSENNYVLAQIIPDRSLGAEASVVTPNVEINGLPADRIDGGAIRDSNLFHSFQEFNIGDLQRVFFANPEGITNIFSRVTGSNLSEIFGTLGVNGNANLFLINPNGIIFGENASLDVGGSFAASTADAIQFGDRGFFSATEPEQPPLLTVKPSAFFFNQINPGRIENRSTAPAGVDLLGEPLSGLRVPDGQSLLLVGGDIAIDRGGLHAPDGRVELAGVAGDGIVGLNVDGNNLNLSFPEDIARADISLTNEAFVNTSGEGGGSMQVQGRNITLSDRSFMFADTLGSQNGRGILIKADQLTLEGGSLVTADVVGSGQGGNITIESERLLVEGGSGVTANVLGSGQGGNVTIESERLLVEGGSGVSATTVGIGNAGDLIIRAADSVEVVGTEETGGASFLITNVNPRATGNAGDLTIETQKLIVRSSQVSASTFGKGNAGDLTVRAADSVEVSGKTVGNNNIENPSGLLAQVNITGEGRSGNLTIETGRLSISNGGIVQVATFGKGDAGNLLIRASEVEVFETPSDNLFPTGIFAGVEVDPDQTVTPPEGEGGDLTIETERLSVRNGAEVSVSTAGLGNSGTLRIEASESVEVVGISPNGNFKSKVSAEVKPDGIGSGGSLSIETGQMIVRDGAEVTVSSVGSGVAGNLEIKARSISLDNQGAITATTRAGDGGDITLKVQDLLLLRRGSQISTTAGTAESGGNGGDINIAADLIVAIPQENSDIKANAFEGKGGKINIDAQNILGFQLQEDPNLSDIDASSKLGLDGIVNINTSEIEPGRELIKLPTEIVDVSRLINQNFCLAGQEGEFIITGKGGLSPSPQDTLNTDAGWEDWRITEDNQGNNQQATATIKEVTPKNRDNLSTIIEAQGWLIAPNGNIVLTAQPTTVQSQDSGLYPFDCRFLRERE